MSNSWFTIGFLATAGAFAFVFLVAMACSLLAGVFAVVAWKRCDRRGGDDARPL